MRTRTLLDSWVGFEFDDMWTVQHVASRQLFDTDATSDKSLHTKIETALRSDCTKLYTVESIGVFAISHSVRVACDSLAVGVCQSRRVGRAVKQAFKYAVGRGRS